MKTRGYIAVFRSIFLHPLFRNRPDRLFAFEWLIGQAAYEAERRRAGRGSVARW